MLIFNSKFSPNNVLQRVEKHVLVAAKQVRVVYSLVILAICLSYSIAIVYWTPYPGLEFSPSWIVRAIEPCSTDVVWCRSNQERLFVGDQLLTIGQLDYLDASYKRGQVPFGGFDRGDLVPLTIKRGTEVVTTEWKMLGATFSNQLKRWILCFILFFPFWIAGTIILVFLQPRNFSWHLMILFNYLTAIWLVVGSHAELRVAYTLPTQRALAWLLAPVYLQLHLEITFPNRVRTRHIFLVLYVLAGLFAILELLQQLPDGIYNVGILLAILGSVTILFVRVLSKRSSSGLMTVRLMLTGLCLALGPGIVFDVVPALLQLPLREEALPIDLATFAIPILPAFYLYAVYKSNLGSFEYRYQRGLSIGTLTLLCIISMFFLFRLSSYFLGDKWWVFALLASIFFLIAIPLQSHFLYVLERLAYAMPSNLQQFNYEFANRLSAAIEKKTLTTLLTDSVLPKLGILHSALFVIQQECAELFYSQNVEHVPDIVSSEVVQQMLSKAGKFRAENSSTDAYSWVRVVILLQCRQKTIAIWLLGNRVEDHYYPEPLLLLLHTLGQQIAVAIENATLFLAQQQHLHALQESLKQQNEMQVQLVQAARLASLGTLVGGVAHELNNPLAGIKLFTTNLKTFHQRGSLSPDLLLGTLKDVEQLVDKASDLVQHFLDFSHQRKPEYQLVDIHDPLHDALSLLQQLRLHDIVIQKELDTNIPVIWGNRNQLEQVFINLFSNARDAMLSRANEPRVLAVRTFRYNEWLGIEVTDTGHGIEPNNLTKIFDPFFTTKDVGQGTGLGLAISFALIKSHGGHLDVESIQGEGTTFTIHLPLAFNQPVKSTTSVPSALGATYDDAK